MRVRVRRLIGYAVGALVAAPVVVTIAVLTLAHLLDPSCGTPGDSGGCEMGAVGIGIASAVPAALIGVAVALWRDWRAS